jgi:HTH-type transcriptional regulator/antitoxin HigA
MQKPPWIPDWSVHPGEILGEALEERNITQLALAAQLGRPMSAVSRIINGKRRITADTALQLEKALGISAQFWVHAQANHDLHLAQQRTKDTRR